MLVNVPDELKAQIEIYAKHHNFDLDEACKWLIRRGLCVFRSKQTSDQIPAELRELVVSDYHTVSGWARFKGTRLPLQILVENLLNGSTPEEFIEDYGSLTLEGIT